MAIIILLHVVVLVLGLLCLMYAIVGSDPITRSLVAVAAIVLLVGDLAAFFYFLESLKR